VYEKQTGIGPVHEKSNNRDAAAAGVQSRMRNEHVGYAKCRAEREDSTGQRMPKRRGGKSTVRQKLRLFGKSTELLQRKHEVLGETVVRDGESS
jgi:hypothetical protein